MAVTTKYQISKRQLYREEVRNALADAIISGQIGPGERLVETQWARELGVSQSPIREAIRELEMIGLVENIPYKGCFVKKQTNKEILDIFRVRVALETMAANDLIDSGKSKEVLPAMKQHMDAMIACADAGDYKAFSMEDVQFHEAMVMGCCNEFLKNLWKQCYVLDNTKLSVLRSKESRQTLARRHEMIFRALEEQDSKRVHREIKAHFDLLTREFEADEN